MSNESVLIPAHEGGSGAFSEWLKSLGLESFLQRYDLPYLVSIGWLRPVARAIFPAFYFEEWSDFPYLLKASKHTQLDYLWGPGWKMDEPDCEGWCMDPTLSKFQENDCVFLDSDGELPVVPLAITHKSGQEIVPYCDYYYHWHAYALIEIIFFSSNGSIYGVPDLHQRLLRMAEHYQERPPVPLDDFYDLDCRWGGKREGFTWLSHFRTTFKAYHFQSRLNTASGCKVIDERRVALDLAAALGIDSLQIRNFLRDHLLVLCKDWQTMMKLEKGFLAKGAWKELQVDVLNCASWVCYLDGIEFDELMCELDYGNFDYRSWARLSDVLDFAYFRDRKFFYSMAVKYLEMAEPLLLDEFKIGIGDYQRFSAILIACPPFGGFVAAFKRLHDELATEDKNSLDLRFRRPVDQLSTMAIRAESCLRYFYLENFCEEESDSLKAYLHRLCKLLPGSEALAERIDPSSAKGRALWKSTMMNQSERMQRIRDIMTRVDDGCDELNSARLRMFLGASAARNYFAHHFDLDGQLIRDKTGQFLIASLIYTVWVFIRRLV